MNATVEDEDSVSSSESMKLKLNAMKATLKKEKRATKKLQKELSETNEDEVKVEGEEATSDEDEVEEEIEIVKHTQSEERAKKKQKINKNSSSSVTDSSTKALMERYSKLVANKNNFGRKNNWYTLKFNVLKDCSAAKYYLVEMELSNNDEQEQLNIWLKATFINDVLKCLASDDPESLPLFNGFHNVIINSGYAPLREKPYGDNTFRGNKKDGITYKEYVNYFLIPREMGTFKTTVEMFKDTMVNVLKSNHFFAMMTVYQNERVNRGGQPGNILRDATSDVWTQLKAEINNRLSYIDSLDAKFVDDDVTDILFKLFGENSIETRYQKFGWKNLDTNPFKKSKKN
jgi:hypothetical protein